MNRFALIQLMREEYGPAGPLLLKRELAQFNIELNKMNRNQKEEFIELLLTHVFIRTSSTTRQRMIRSRLRSVLELPPD